MIPFIINGKWEDPEVRDIAQFNEVIKDKNKLNAFNTWNFANEFARPFSLPPGSPPEALKILRKAFKATMEDKDYIADANKSKLTVDYIPASKRSSTSNKFIRFLLKSKSGSISWSRNPKPPKEVLCWSICMPLMRA